MEMDVVGGGGRRCLWVADQANQKTRSKTNSKNQIQKLKNQICLKKRKSKGKSKQNRKDLTVDGSSKPSAVVVIRLGSSAMVVARLG
jgi:hypothetical protein